MATASRFDPALFENRAELEADCLLCSICLYVCNDVCEVRQCGHLFCRECLSQLMAAAAARSSGLPAKCPMDMRSVVSTEGVTFSVVSHNRRIANSTVRCPNSGSVGGCTWRGAHRALCDHLSHECPAVPIACEYCAQDLPRREHKEHSEECPARPRPCPHCLVCVAPPNRETHERTECTGLFVPCPNGCEADARGRVTQVLQRDLAEHRLVCPRRRSRCPFAELDAACCPEELERGRLSEHLAGSTEDISRHLRLASEEIAALRREVCVLRGKVLPGTGTRVARRSQFQKLEQLTLQAPPVARVLRSANGRKAVLTAGAAAFVLGDVRLTQGMHYWIVQVDWDPKMGHDIFLGVVPAGAALSETTSYSHRGCYGLETSWLPEQRVYKGGVPVPMNAVTFQRGDTVELFLTLGTPGAHLTIRATRDVGLTIDMALPRSPTGWQPHFHLGRQGNSIRLL